MPYLKLVTLNLLELLLKSLLFIRESFESKNNFLDFSLSFLERFFQFLIFC
jgi:hypothetical protein